MAMVWVRFETERGAGDHVQERGIHELVPRSRHRADGTVCIAVFRDGVALSRRSVRAGRSAANRGPDAR